MKMRARVSRFIVLALVVTGFVGVVATQPAAADPVNCGSLGVPPTLVVPSTITVSTTNPAGTPVSFSVSATDCNGVPLAVTCTPPSGSVFPVGSTTVRCVAYDQYGNAAAAAFNVVVQLSMPTTKDQCSNGGWENYPQFTNQGQCIKYVNENSGG